MDAPGEFCTTGQFVQVAIGAGGRPIPVLDGTARIRASATAFPAAATDGGNEP